MRKTFGIDRGSFLHNFDSGGVAHVCQVFRCPLPKFFLFRNQSKHLSIPQYHILILAWCALVILYGEPGLSPTPGQAEHDGFLGCLPLTN